MSVVGFDVGNENCVIAVAKQRGIDVLLNDESNRENPAMVSFGEKQRFMGAAAAASATMHPKSTISQLKRLIGRKFREPDVQNDLRLFPFEASEGSDGGIQIQLRYMGEIQSFSPVQILGMLLSHLKQTAEKSLKTPVSDCVIGIPSYFTNAQRLAYLDAAAIAGLRPLRLMHDSTATALGYGIYKTDLVANSSPTYIVFIDIGHCDTQVCVASFESGSMRVRSHAFDRNLGGRDFDEVLFNHFAVEFKEKYSIDVYTNTKACVRLRASCEKLKKVLSANAEAQLNIECLMEEKDVRSFIKREEFEQLSAGLLERLIVPCQKALADSGLILDHIHSVELVGSGSRIPAISKMLSSLFKRELGRTVNASECVARGCALQCAMLSPVFRVRDYEVQDFFPFAVGFSSEKGPINTISNELLFPKGQVFPSVKVLTLHRENTFHLEAFYANHDEITPDLPTPICSFKIGPFHISYGEAARVKVRVQLNLHGIVTIDSASLIEHHKENITSEDVISENNHQSAATKDDTLDASSGPTGNEPKAIKRMEIPVIANLSGALTKDELSEAKQRENSLVEQDLKMESTKDKKNALESFVYEMRDKMLNTYRNTATESERECIARNLQETEDWLYEDGDDESENAYIEKLNDIKKLIDPIESRFKDGEERVQASKDLLKIIADSRMAAESLPPPRKNAVLDECHKAERWLQERSAEQESLPKDANPEMQSGEIRRKADALNATCKYIGKSNSPPMKPEHNGGSQGSRNSDDMEVD
ncbi:PREDICTED: heat shock 70 kDa protein 16 [Camelina sativa]|uniref:Heat shock 70 kDa protein 16 n=1 Tax=Camelina sativa TaxID=90675 RepID=A0ABM0XZ79_CAMSA|nr:PREDICTED: heat shock 70 kDa protein 16 [Camelina sativa]XP_010493121.1 PREDICTED: heat shock 70 kDa protein 16 [Camelina sativa]